MEPTIIYRGYIVDTEKREFRKHLFGEEFTVIPFESESGESLREEMIVTDIDLWIECF